MRCCQGRRASLLSQRHKVAQTDLGDETLSNHMLSGLADREAGQRQAEAVREFTGQCLNLDDEAGEKSGLYARPEAAPPGRGVEKEQIACALC